MDWEAASAPFLTLKETIPLIAKYTKIPKKQVDLVVSAMYELMTFRLKKAMPVDLGRQAGVLSPRVYIKSVGPRIHHRFRPSQSVVKATNSIEDKVAHVSKFGTTRRGMHQVYFPGLNVVGRNLAKSPYRIKGEARKRKNLEEENNSIKSTDNIEISGNESISEYMAKILNNIQK